MNLGSETLTLIYITTNAANEGLLFLYIKDRVSCGQRGPNLISNDTSMPPHEIDTGK